MVKTKPEAVRDLVVALRTTTGAGAAVASGDVALRTFVVGCAAAVGPAATTGAGSWSSGRAGAVTG